MDFFENRAKSTGLQWMQTLTFLLVTLSMLLLRAVDLDRFVTTDEGLWIVRSANFYYALGQRDPSGTYLSEHPGVITMWAGTAGFLWRFPMFRGVGLEDELDVFQYEEILSKQAHLNPEDILAASRLIMVLIQSALLGLGFIYAKRLLGARPAILGFLLIAFDPFHIAHTRLLHLDGMLTNTMLLSMLAFLSYVNRRRRIDLAISGFAAGLCWLTKSPGLFLIPAILTITILRYLADKKQTFQNGPRNLPSTKSDIWQPILPVLMWLGIALVTFFLLWPAMWVNPFEIVAKVFGGALGHASFGHESPVFFNGEIYNSGKIGLSLFYPVMIAWRITPVVLFGLLLSLLVLLSKPKSLLTSDTAYHALTLAILGALFIVFMTLAEKKFDRYVLPIFPILDLLAALGLMKFFSWIWRWLPSKGFQPYKKLIWSIWLVILVGAQIFFALKASPYYLTYYNPLLGGIRKASQEFMIGWGEGLEQAAQYLSEKPDSEELRVISWYRTGCFSYYFDGESRYIHIVPEIGAEKLQEYIENFDYAVIYYHQWQRQLPKDLLDYLDQIRPEHSIWIDGVEYVRIYRLNGRDL